MHVFTLCPLLCLTVLCSYLLRILWLHPDYGVYVFMYLNIQSPWLPNENCWIWIFKGQPRPIGGKGRPLFQRGRRSSWVGVGAILGVFWQEGEWKESRRKRDKTQIQTTKRRKVRKKFTSRLSLNQVGWNIAESCVSGKYWPLSDVQVFEYYISTFLCTELQHPLHWTTHCF